MFNPQTELKTVSYGVLNDAGFLIKELNCSF